MTPETETQCETKQKQNEKKKKQKHSKQKKMPTYYRDLEDSRGRSGEDEREEGGRTEMLEEEGVLHGFNYIYIRHTQGLKLKCYNLIQSYGIKINKNL